MARKYAKALLQVGRLFQEKYAIICKPPIVDLPSPNLVQNLFLTHDCHGGEKAQ